VEELGAFSHWDWDWTFEKTLKSWRCVSYFRLGFWCTNSSEGFWLMI
jgi:hypothetical protein